MRKFYGIVMIFIATLFSACDSGGTEAVDNSLGSIIAKDKVVIGVFGDKPPFGFVDSDGQKAGFDVYIAKAVAKELLGDENKVEFVLVEAQNRVEFLKSNKVDIIFANFTQTKEREEVVDFAMPYMKVALGVVSNGGKITTIDDLQGKTLIVNKGTTADFYFTSNYPSMKILKFDQNTEAFLALKDARGDALAHDNLLLFAWANENPPFAVGITHLGNDDVIAPAVKKGSVALLNRLNEIMIKLNQDGVISSAYDTTLKGVYGDNIDPKDILVDWMWK